MGRGLAIGLSACGLLGLLVIVAVMMMTTTKSVKTNLNARDRAERDLQNIQKKLNEQGAQVENMANSIDNTAANVPANAPAANGGPAGVRDRVPPAIHSEAEDALKEME